MSFASYCKDEASMIKGLESHCQMAELEALIRLNGEIVLRGGQIMITFLTSNSHVASCFMKLAKGLYNAKTSLLTKEVERFDKRQVYEVTLEGGADILVKEMDLFNDVSLNHAKYEEKECCKKSYLRGAFLARGSVNDPAKSAYHLEIAARSNDEAVFIQHLMNSFDLNAKLSKRRNDLIIYIKEVSKIADFLRIIGISQMVFKFEEIQVQREFKNDINRKVNSEIANEIKTMSAAKAQLQNIQYLEYNYPLEKMDPKILLIMKVRKDNPEASFKELIDILNNRYEEKITKSGLNHRFIKIKEMVEELKKAKKEGL